VLGGKWLTTMMVMIGNVELLEAVTAYSEVFQGGRRSNCETTAEFHEWVFRGMTLLSLSEESQHTDLKRRGVIRSRSGALGACIYSFTAELQQRHLPNASIIVLNNAMSESSHTQTPYNATPSCPS
jgi:hypothetical protein